MHVFFVFNSGTNFAHTDTYLSQLLFPITQRKTHLLYEFELLGSNRSFNHSKEKQYTEVREIATIDEDIELPAPPPFVSVDSNSKFHQYKTNPKLITSSSRRKEK